MKDRLPIFCLIVLTIALAIVVYRGSLSPDCEHQAMLVNNATTVNAHDSALIDGVRMGCFHNE